jgi:hypothetical protein
LLILLVRIQRPARRYVKPPVNSLLLVRVCEPQIIYICPFRCVGLSGKPDSEVVAGHLRRCEQAVSTGRGQAAAPKSFYAGHSQGLAGASAGTASPSTVSTCPKGVGMHRSSPGAMRLCHSLGSALSPPSRGAGSAQSRLGCQKGHLVLGQTEGREPCSLGAPSVGASSSESGPPSADSARCWWTAAG